MAGRQPKVMASVGRRATGKSYENIDMIYEYITTDVVNNRHGRKCLILDINNEFSNFEFKGQRHSIKRLAIKDIKRFTLHKSIEVRRIAPFKDDNTMLKDDDMSKLMMLILKYFRNGLIYLEDINGIFGDNIPPEFISALARARHLGLDMIFSFQGIGRLGHPKILSNTNVLRLHKTLDSVARHGDKFKEKIDILSIAENIVNARYLVGARNKDINQYFHLYVDIDLNKIQVGRNPFTYQEAVSAIDKYVKTMAKKRGSIAELSKEFLDEYFCYT